MIRASFLPESVREVFNIYLENEEPSYDNIIKQTKLVKVLLYPTLVFMHFMMVIMPEWVDNCVHYFIMVKVFIRIGVLRSTPKLNYYVSVAFHFLLAKVELDGRKTLCQDH